MFSRPLQIRAERTQGALPHLKRSPTPQLQDGDRRNSVRLLQEVSPHQKRLRRPCFYRLCVTFCGNELEKSGEAVRPRPFGTRTCVSVHNFVPYTRFFCDSHSQGRTGKLGHPRRLLLPGLASPRFHRDSRALTTARGIQKTLLRIIGEVIDPLM